MTFQNHMGVGAPEAEGINADNQFTGFFKRPIFGNHFNIPVIELNIRIKRFYANGRRYHPMPNTAQCLYQSRYAGSGFKMA